MRIPIYVPKIRYFLLGLPNKKINSGDVFKPLYPDFEYNEDRKIVDYLYDRNSNLMRNSYSEVNYRILKVIKCEFYIGCLTSSDDHGIKDSKDMEPVPYRSDVDIHRQVNAHLVELAIIELFKFNNPDHEYFKDKKADDHKYRNDMDNPANYDPKIRAIIDLASLQYKVEWCLNTDAFSCEDAIGDFNLCIGKSEQENPFA